MNISLKAGEKNIYVAGSPKRQKLLKQEVKYSVAGRYAAHQVEIPQEKWREIMDAAETVAKGAKFYSGDIPKNARSKLRELLGSKAQAFWKEYLYALKEIRGL